MENYGHSEGKREPRRSNPNSSMPPWAKTDLVPSWQRVLHICASALLWEHKGQTSVSLGTLQIKACQKPSVPSPLVLGRAEPSLRCRRDGKAAGLMAFPLQLETKADSCVQRDQSGPTHSSGWSRRKSRWPLALPSTFFQAVFLPAGAITYPQILEAITYPVGATTYPQILSLPKPLSRGGEHFDSSDFPGGKAPQRIIFPSLLPVTPVFPHPCQASY